MQTKIAIRKAMRARCKAIPIQYKNTAALAAVSIATKAALFTRSAHIACYLAVRDEFDATPLIEAIWLAKKHCYLPVLSAEKEKELSFVRYRYGDALRLNHHGILEPSHPSQRIQPQDLDLVILPLIAFDRFGHRLGTGGGYYDRTFADLSMREKLIGLGYAIQEVDQLPADPWDVLMGGVLTEKELVKVE